MGLRNRVQATPEIIDSYIITTNRMFEPFLPRIQWKARPREMIATFVLPALQPSSLRKAVGDTAKWEGVENDADETLQILGNPRGQVGVS